MHDAWLRVAAVVESGSVSLLQTIYKAPQNGNFLRLDQKKRKTGAEQAVQPQSSRRKFYIAQGLQKKAARLFNKSTFVEIKKHIKYKFIYTMLPPSQIVFQKTIKFQ